MRVNCQWITTNLEDYFCDRLSAEQHQLAQGHIQNCRDCGEQVRQLQDIDPLIKGYFQHELSLARAPKRLRSWLVPMGVTAALASLVLAVTIFQTPGVMNKPATDALPVASSAPVVEPVPPVDKAQGASEPAEAVRAKPQTPQQNAEPLKIEGNARRDQALDFLVTDPAGYSRTIENYRGYVLLFGVWNSAQPQTGANLEAIYLTFGSNPKLRLLGVSNGRETKPLNTTFPVVYNQGSRLMGARSGDFVLVDETGGTKLRGSLLEDYSNLVNTLNGVLK